MYLLYKDIHQNDTEDKWLSLVRETFQQIGLGHVWRNQSTFSVKRLKYTVKNKLEDLYKKFWMKEKCNVSKFSFYNDITNDYGMEPYLTSCS